MGLDSQNKVFPSSGQTRYSRYVHTYNICIHNYTYVLCISGIFVKINIQNSGQIGVKWNLLFAWIFLGLSSQALVKRIVEILILP